MARYIDIDINFQPHPVTGDIVIKTDEEAVKQSVKNLVSYNFYDKWDPNIGSNVRGLLFENITPITAINLEKNIEQTILNFEPRVELQFVQVRGLPDRNEYQVTIVFNIVNIRTPITLEFILGKVR